MRVTRWLADMWHRHLICRFGISVDRDRRGDTAQATQLRAEQEAALKQALTLGPEVERLATQMALFRTQNHLAELFTEAFRRKD